MCYKKPLNFKIRKTVNKIDADCLKEFIKNNKVISNTQQSFENERYNVFTNEINQIVLNSNDDTRIPSNDSIETYAYSWNKYLKFKKE